MCKAIFIENLQTFWAFVIVLMLKPATRNVILTLLLILWSIYTASTIEMLILWFKVYFYTMIYLHHVLSWKSLVSQYPKLSIPQGSHNRTNHHAVRSEKCWALFPDLILEWYSTFFNSGWACRKSNVTK